MVSERSYEIYLVHMAALVVVKPLCQNTAVYTLVWLTATFIWASAVYGAHSVLLQCCKKRCSRWGGRK